MCVCVCENSRGQFKKKCDFQGCSGIWFLTWEFPRAVTQFCKIPRGESLFSLNF